MALAWENLDDQDDEDPWWAALAAGVDPGLTLTERLAEWRPAWMTRAACRGVSTDVFYPPVGRRTAPAKAICDRCPVRSDCLSWAHLHGEPDGIWGGQNRR